MVGRGQGKCGHWEPGEGCPCWAPTPGLHPDTPTQLPDHRRRRSPRAHCAPAREPGCGSPGTHVRRRARAAPTASLQAPHLFVCARASIPASGGPCLCLCVYMGGTKPGLPAWTRASLLPARPHQVTKALESEGKQLGLPALGDHYLPWEKPASRAEAVVPFTSGKKPIPVPTGPGPPRDNGDDRPRGRERRASWEGRCGHQKAMERSPGGPSVPSCRAPVPDALSWGWCAAPTPREDREGGGLLHGHGRPPRTRRGSHGHPAALPRGLAGPGSQDSAHQPLEGAPTPHGSHSRP